MHKISSIGQKIVKVLSKTAIFHLYLWSHSTTIMKNIETIQIQNKLKEPIKVYIFLISNPAFLEEVKTYDTSIWQEKFKNTLFFQNSALTTNPFVMSLMSHNVSKIILVYNDRKSIIGLCIVAVTFNGKTVISHVISGNDTETGDVTNLLVTVENNKIKLQKAILSHRERKIVRKKVTSTSHK